MPRIYIVVPTLGSVYSVDRGELIQHPMERTSNPEHVEVYVDENSAASVDWARGVEDVDRPLTRTILDTLTELEDLARDHAWRSRANATLQRLKDAAVDFSALWEEGASESIDGNLIEEYPPGLPSFDEVTAALAGIEIAGPDVRGVERGGSR